MFLQHLARELLKPSKPPLPYYGARVLGESFPAYPSPMIPFRFVGTGGLNLLPYFFFTCAKYHFLHREVDFEDDAYERKNRLRDRFQKAFTRKTD